MTKIWTATMIMQLIDEGLLSLDTTVSEVLPGARLGTADVCFVWLCRKITWLIGASWWIRGTGVHRIHHVARIHHANPAAGRS